MIEALALSGRRELRAYFSAQDIVFGAIAVPLITGMSFGLAALIGDPREGCVAAAVGLAGLGAGLALANVFGVVLAYPLQKRAGSPLPQQAQGYGAHAVGTIFGTLACVAQLKAIPVIVLGNLTIHDSAAIALPVLFGCAVAYGLGLAWLGVRAAAALHMFLVHLLSPCVGVRSGSASAADALDLGLARLVRRRLRIEGRPAGRAVTPAPRATGSIGPWLSRIDWTVVTSASSTRTLTSVPPRRTDSE